MLKDKRYIILAKNKKSGKIYGYIPHGTKKPTLDPNRVYVWAPLHHTGEKDANYWYDRYIREKDWELKSSYNKYRYGQKAESVNQYEWFYLRALVHYYSKEHKNFEVKVFRVGSKNCPVEIDWSEQFEAAKKYKGRKYDPGYYHKDYYRPKFSVTHPEKW